MARVLSPDGTVYVVHIRWLPWEPRIRVRTWDTGFDILSGLPIDGDEFGIMLAFLLVLLVIPLVIVLLPVIVLAIELALLGLVIGGLLLMRFAFGAPWLVDVRTVATGERTTFKVDGYARAKQVRADLVYALERGPLRSAPPGATPV